MFKTTSFLNTLLVAGIFTLMACGGGGAALISQSEIDTARASGNLPALYDKATQLVTESRGSSKEEAISLRSKIVALLVQDKSQAVDQVLAKHEKAPETVTRTELNQLSESINPMQVWSATDYARIKSKIDAARQTLESLISKAKTDASDSDLSNVDQVLALKKAAQLAGDNQPEADVYQKRLEEVTAQLNYQGNEGLSKRLYTMAIQSAEGGLKLDPGNIQFESMLSQGQAGLFEKDFRFALESGKPESAYQAIQTVADKPIFLQLKKSMGKSMSLLANFFAGSAAKSYQAGDLLGAYNNFVKGRDIQTKTALTKPGFIQEKNYLDLLMKKASDANLGEGTQLSLMRVVREFDRNYPGLDTAFLKANDAVTKRAMTKLSIAEFKEVPSQNSVMASVGRRVGSKLEKILFDQLGKEVMIVTNAQGSTVNSYEGLALQIDGEVLQAAIEESTNQGTRTQKVQTGVHRVETEEYQKWAKRKRGDAPTQYIETPIEEDIQLTVEHIRKQAIAEVAFRVIEPATGSILLTDTVVKESEFSGESINEFQKGDFHQKYERADLPSDIKIMDALSSELASNLGEKLSSYLKSPENVFYQKSQEMKSQGNSVAAIELLANAIALGESKGQDVSAWVDEVKALALDVK
ncbi:hypothetical protein FLL45_03820 [Aliikangiella marina]|uniref:Curli production assembly/transport component CsgG n=1 Tax=Aliikangiella marina TaxID=1712262 RepID=A0A545TIQ2_9GAMM|nr:hypothetical protein [Aliikangiella marina]TQV77088.1 hypothetical protein FLL45_03820 [Aliikangiella marina]